jgi:hypothetical protein
MSVLPPPFFGVLGENKKGTLYIYSVFLFVPFFLGKGTKEQCSFLFLFVPF